MKINSFQIKNFKGIENLTLNLDSRPKSKIFTLIGLNESGKTTILEAISYFGNRAASASLLPMGLDKNIDTQLFIPINKIDNFNGSIDIKGVVEFEDDEYTSIKNEILKDHQIKISHFAQSFSITVRNTFSNSTETTTKNEWDLEFFGKIGNEKNAKKLSKENWQLCVSVIRKYLPEILYFPNFLFDFPDKIYLQPFNTSINQYEYYKALIQDILDSLNNKLDIQSHIIERIEKGDFASKRQLTGVLLKMSANVTELVFGSWNKIFNKNISKKEVNIEWGIDILKVDNTSQKQAIYLQFLLKDRDSQYRISERSLGFRWFFVFLLLTQFRNSRLRKSRKVLFLFDEPASNLHSAAQTQLLDSFEKLGNVIYTTHSHHLVNPLWLENTYVVKNEGLDYDKEDDFLAKKSKVTLLPYRAFVAKYPSQTTYFQPVLDVLEYYPSRLENIPDVVITEGKNDYYTLLYMQYLLGVGYEINILPGTSASNLDGPIQLYLAWGKNFIALLDSDKEGIGQKKRYLDNFGMIIKEKIITLADINNSWANFSCENLITDDDKLRLLHTKYDSNQIYDKILFNRAIQENLVNKILFKFSDESLDNFKILFLACKTLLKNKA